jgi:hypothetical protein
VAVTWNVTFQVTARNRTKSEWVVTIDLPQMLNRYLGRVSLMWHGSGEWTSLPAEAGETRCPAAE